MVWLDLKIHNERDILHKQHFKLPRSIKNCHPLYEIASLHLCVAFSPYVMLEMRPCYTLRPCLRPIRLRPLNLNTALSSEYWKLIGLGVFELISLCWVSAAVAQFLWTSNETPWLRREGSLSHLAWKILLTTPGYLR